MTSTAAARAHLDSARDTFMSALTTSIFEEFDRNFTGTHPQMPAVAHFDVRLITDELRTAAAEPRDAWFDAATLADGTTLDADHPLLEAINDTLDLPDGFSDWLRMSAEATSGEYVTLRRPTAATFATDTNSALQDALRAAMVRLTGTVHSEFPSATAIVLSDDTQMGDQAPVWTVQAIVDDTGTEHAVSPNLEETEGLFYELQGHVTALVDAFDGWSHQQRGRPLFTDTEVVALVDAHGRLPLIDGDAIAASDELDTALAQLAAAVRIHHPTAVAIEFLNEGEDDEQAWTIQWTHDADGREHLFAPDDATDAVTALSDLVALIGADESLRDRLTFPSDTVLALPETTTSDAMDRAIADNPHLGASFVVTLAASGEVTADLERAVSAFLDGARPYERLRAIAVEAARRNLDPRATVALAFEAATGHEGDSETLDSVMEVVAATSDDEAATSHVPRLEGKRRKRAAKVLVELSTVNLATAYRVIDDARFDLLPAGDVTIARELIADLAAAGTPATVNAVATVLLAGGHDARMASTYHGTPLLGLYPVKGEPQSVWAVQGEWSAITWAPGGTVSSTTVADDCSDPVRVANALVRAAEARA